MNPFLAGLITGASVTGVGGFFALALCAAARRADDDGERAIRLLREQRGVRRVEAWQMAEYNTGGETWRRN